MLAQYYLSFLVIFREDCRVTVLQSLSITKSSNFQSSMTIFHHKLLTREDRVLTNEWPHPPSTTLFDHIFIKSVIQKVTIVTLNTIWRLNVIFSVGSWPIMPQNLPKHCYVNCLIQMVSILYEHIGKLRESLSGVLNYPNKGSLLCHLNNDRCPGPFWAMWGPPLTSIHKVSGKRPRTRPPRVDNDVTGTFWLVHSHKKKDESLHLGVFSSKLKSSIQGGQQHLSTDSGLLCNVQDGSLQCPSNAFWSFKNIPLWKQPLETQPQIENEDVVTWSPQYDPSVIRTNKRRALSLQEVELDGSFLILHILLEIYTI